MREEKLTYKFLRLGKRLTNPSNQTLNSLDSSRPNRRLSQNPKTGGFRGLVLPGNDLKTCITVNSAEKTCRFWGPGN